MLPSWYKTWKEENPTEIYRPAIVLGTVGGAALIAAIFLMLIQPLTTESLQTGPRGTGMSRTEFVFNLAEPDPGIAEYEAITPDDGDLIAAMRAWTGIPTLFEDEEDYQTIIARRMIEMTQAINEEWAGHVQAIGETGVVCYTCHRGQPVPPNDWYDTGPVVSVMEGWSANQNRVTPLSQFTSLPSDALRSYLIDYEQISVHDFSSRVAGVPGRDVASIQNAERTYSMMNYFANSLGVGCVFCHNSRAFYDGLEVTAQWANASLGILMVQDINALHVIPLEEFLPPERMGPAGTGPMVACGTCHNGYQRPLQGMGVIGDWPQLATVGAEIE